MMDRSTLQAAPASLLTPRLRLEKPQARHAAVVMESVNASLAGLSFSRWAPRPFDDDGARRFWKRTIETGPQSESDLDRAITLVEETGAISETMARARAYADQARQALTAVAPCETRDVLADIADFCVERAY